MSLVFIVVIFVFTVGLLCLLSAGATGDLRTRCLNKRFQSVHSNVFVFIVFCSDTKKKKKCVLNGVLALL